MDATHLHLILTHFPIVGTIIGIGILTYGQFAKNDEIKKVALVTFVLMAILTIPVFLTGEEAEETVDHITGVSEQLIENHEELAEKAIWLMGLLGVLSIFNFFVILKKLSFAKTLSLITLVVSLGTFGLFAKVGSTGGEIRHSEIRKSNTNNDNGTPAGAKVSLVPKRTLKRTKENLTKKRFELCGFIWRKFPCQDKAKLPTA